MNSLLHTWITAIVTRSLQRHIISEFSWVEDTSLSGRRACNLLASHCWPFQVEWPATPGYVGRTRKMIGPDWDRPVIVPTLHLRSRLGRYRCSIGRTNPTAHRQQSDLADRARANVALHSTRPSCIDLRVWCLKCPVPGAPGVLRCD